MRLRVLMLLGTFLTICSSSIANTGSSDTLFSHSGARVKTSGPDSCHICHNQQTLLLKSESPELCYPCHTAIEAKSLKAYRHVAVVNDRFPGLECEGCHRIHRAQGTHLLSHDEFDLCNSCHQETRRFKTHPVVGSIDAMGRAVVAVAPDGKDITCASHCHDVHGSDKGFLCRLEPGRQLCISCHKEFE